MRLIEKMYEDAKTLMNLDWLEIKGPKSNSLIHRMFQEVRLNDMNVKEYDDSDIAYCSIAMNWICQRNGGRGTMSARARSWMSWGKESEGNEGDLVVLRRGTSSWQGHITFLKKKGLLYVECMGWNQNNDFCVQRYLRANVLGYRTSKD